jgi:hypothetical protein
MASTKDSKLCVTGIALFAQLIWHPVLTVFVRQVLLGFVVHHVVAIITVVVYRCHVVVVVVVVDSSSDCVIDTVDAVGMSVAVLLSSTHGKGCTEISTRRSRGVIRMWDEHR